MAFSPRKNRKVDNIICTKIDKIQLKMTKFKDVAIGQWFLYESNLYIKVWSIYKEINDDTFDHVNAIQIQGELPGDCEFFNEYDEVIQINI